jgi:hypothetical protein
MLVQSNVAHSVIAQFLLDVVRSGFAWGLSCGGDIVAVSGHGHQCLPLWSDGDVARLMQQRHWPKLTVTRIALGEIQARCLPEARKNSVPIGLGVAVDHEAVVVPVQLVEAGLREAERYLREKAARRAARDA